MTSDPVQDLIDQLKLMRVELGDVKKRQLTEERLKHLQAALEGVASGRGQNDTLRICLIVLATCTRPL